jgi:hypothetical protein
LTRVPPAKLVTDFASTGQKQENVFMLSQSKIWLFIPLLVGGVADASSLQVAMWLPAIGSIALIVGVR